ncbi:hypothetical protein AA23498_1265 [Acetobacter nitrogenifigens DSM 23921 = NBRC 105050]|uniref:Phosphoribosyltransferase n=1 Tax=Acetobacter nitrogenifigens DSM 23921 = NBRC 105050 TaxID=1120919 RepID=A0A511XCU5_9PROT|nr:phosphoribosyltransferase family protein [Acetobacter nitrogenifigens]GBQ91740.1 hypothetical protein AA23498_1265 [Acetobacter nitrogenifigens DSM 23921 = NBRC 105050]GEN60783.1 phosphoribosyltransferase [Acetobacter nitrogenifigens DSM 23921 = NBRC 105050]
MSHGQDNQITPGGSSPPLASTTWRVDVAGREIELPITPVKPDLAIALMMITDMGVSFGDHIGAELAKILRPLQPEIVVGAATLGIPVAIEVTRHLGLDQYIILQKSPKLHLTNALSRPLQSITSHGDQALRLDRAALPLLMRRRVVIVDDVIATGGSIAACIALARDAAAEVVGVGCVLTDGADWRARLGEDAGLVRSLAHVPQFRPTTLGVWEPIEE